MIPSKRIEAIIEGVLGREKGFVDHPSDRGGPTNWGITEATARENGWQGRMQDMPQTFARNVYYRRYVYIPWFDRVAERSPGVGEELVDTGVVMGPGVASTFFQRLLNIFNGRGRYYADIIADGRIGKGTLAAFDAYLNKRGDEGEQVMVAALNCLQGGRFIDIAEHNESQEDFVYGWIRSRVLGLA